MYKSKQEVYCAYCDWHGRRDKYSDHVLIKHPDEKPRTRDQSSLYGFFKTEVQKSGSKTQDINDEECGEGTRKLEVETRGPEATDVEEYPGPEIPDVEDRGPSKKRRKHDFTELNSSCRGESSDVVIGAKKCDINEQLASIKETLSGISKYLTKAKVFSANEELEKDVPSSSCSQAEEEFKTKIKLIRISRSVPEICQLMPCLEGGIETVQCSPCIENYKNIPKEVSVLKTSNFGIFSLPNEQQLMQPTQSMEFRNFKTHLIDHLQSNAHKWCIDFSEAMERKEILEKNENEKVGLRVARAAYSAVKEGKGGKFFERQLSLNVLNDADVGELNHSREFYREFVKNIFFTINTKICDFLSSKNPVTKHLPLVSITADKITKLHRTYQITCLITLIEGVQSCIVIDISPCGTSHTGDVLVQKLQSALDKCNINLKKQLNGMAFDGQYFDLSVDKKLASLCENITYEFLLPMWDLAHRLECVLRDVRKVQSLSWIDSQAQIVVNLMKNYNWGIGYEELIALADELQVEVWNPKSFQQTRFVQSELRVYKTFLKDFKLFFVDLQKKRTECIRRGNNTDAKNYSMTLKKFSKPSFIYRLLGVVDILEMVTKFSCISQNVNVCIWTIFDHYSSMKSTLNDMIREMTSGKVTEEIFPSVFKEMESLKNNVFEDCLLVDEEVASRSKRFQTSEETTEDGFRGSRQKLENFCTSLLEKLETRISEPPIVENMRRCFSSENLTSLHDDMYDNRVKESLEILIIWINKNRGCNFKSDDLFLQLRIMKNNLKKTPFLKNLANTSQADKNSSLIIKDNNIIKEVFTNPQVYNEIPEIIYLLENCLKICSEAVCESIGSVIGNHLHNRNILSDTLFNEVFISWNGPPIHKASQLLKESLDRHFHGRRYHFTRFSSASRLKVYATSKVIDNLHKEKGRLPFLGDN